MIDFTSNRSTAYRSPFYAASTVNFNASNTFLKLLTQITKNLQSTYSIATFQVSFVEH